MADGLCSGDSVGGCSNSTMAKTQVQEHYDAIDDGCDLNECGLMDDFYMTSASDKLFEKLRASSGGRRSTDDGEEEEEDEILIKHHEGFLECGEDDFRKKRCVDRYDSSESSDSGVATLSCTDCSGSSTASSDITDPGSPFSTASSHSEDSALQPSTKMPPTQQTAAHHPHWPWTADEGPSINKRSMHDEEKTAFPKRLKSNEEPTSKQSPPCLNASSNINLNNNYNNNALKSVDTTSPNDHKLVAVNKKLSKLEHHKQGKITEYFKSQIKLHVIKKASSNGKPSTEIINKIQQINNKFVPLVDQQMQFNGIRTAASNNNNNNTIIRGGAAVKKPTDSPRARKVAQVSVPRKILPAPSKIPDNLTISNNRHQSPHHFTPTVTLTAVGFPPNLTYIHTKTPKPPDNGGLYVPQFATLSSDKINGIPIINRTPCLNVIQPMQKITTINDFNCVKLNATVVPIVKLNALSSRLNRATPNLANVALSVETAVPTVLSAKSKVPLVTASFAPKHHGATSASSTTNVTCMQVDSAYQQEKCRAEEAHKPPDEVIRRNEDDKLSSPDSDSGISLRENLEVTVVEPVVVPSQKSPILSQPKTIRFPAKQEAKEEIKDTKSTPSVESGQCRWAECSAQFDTSGALLEHLQVKHVISQAAQEHYVCFWLGCKVHGRTSCSRSWLERHVLAHAGTKPFRCIVDGCGQRFNSQTALERHVNGHFTSDGNSNGSTKKSTDSSSAKLFKRNGKKIRFRRQPWSARMFDFIDPGIMEGLQHKLLTMTQNGTHGGTVDVMSQIMARRVESNGSIKFLIKWNPSEIIPDEWVLEKDYVQSKTVPISSLRTSARDALHSHLFPNEEEGNQTQRRRKPIQTKRKQT